MYFFQRPFKKDIIILKCHRESETKLKIQLGSDLNEFFKIKSLLRQNRGLWPWTSLSAQNFHSHINLAEKYSLLGRLVLKVKRQSLTFIKTGQSQPLFVYFRHFLITNSISIDGVPFKPATVIMVGADDTTELW